MSIFTSPLEEQDSELWQFLQQETWRQEQHIELIASENYASRAVLQAQGSLLTNKYAEGYPGKRYYGGCQFVDEIEQLAINRAKKLFAADYVNVQPHSGSQANFAAYMALLNPGDKILGMDLSQGGHLTHGSPVNFSGKFYQPISYGLNQQGYIDYDAVAALAEQHQPKLLIGGFSAYARVIDWSRLRQIADSVGAYLLVDMAHVAGLVAAGLYPSPLPHAHVVTSTTHKTLAGPRGGLILAAGGSEALYKKLNAALFPGAQGGPLMHVIAGKAVAFKEAMQPEFVQYQQQVLHNAQLLATCLLSRGFHILSGGTDNHLLLMDLTPQGLTGQAADARLAQANITVNKNSIPNDPHSPFVTSGIRIGTPAITRRGFKAPEVQQVASWIADLLEREQDSGELQVIKQQAELLCQQFPVYQRID